MDRGDLSPEEARQLEEWLEADARHLGAYARARAVCRYFDRARALGPAFTGEPATRTLAKQRWPLALAAGVAFLAIAIALYLRVPSQTWSTAVGETRLLTAEDGTSILLNTASRITLKYSSTERRIRLEQGEALFDVAPEASRPFIVETGATRVRVLGTSFAVRRMPDESVRVVVRQGMVEVTNPASDEVATPVRLSANTSAVAPPAQGVKVARLSPEEVVRELSWQDGMVALSGVTLREAAAEFARYSQVRIVIDDPEIAGRTVTGLFASDNPVGFAQAIATSMDLAVHVDGRVVRLLPKNMPAAEG